MIDREFATEDEQEMFEAGKDLDEIARAFSGRSAEDRAYILIKTFFNGANGQGDEDKTDKEYSHKAQTMFCNWLLSPENKDAKENALYRVFNEIMETECPEMEQQLFDAGQFFGEFMLQEN